MKPRIRIVQALTVLALLWALMGLSSAYDAIERHKPLKFGRQPESYSAQQSTGETVWHTDVNSSCSGNDYDIVVNIDVDLQLIKDPRLVMTNYDVDYNDPQGCEGGPEVDVAYINGHRLPGILQGANNSWSTNRFTLDPAQLVKGENHITIDVDSTNTDWWCLGVGYVEISAIVGFNVIKTTPADGEENVRWDSPEIYIEFTDKVDSSTLYDNVLLQYKDDGGQKITVDTVRDMAGDTVVRVTPNSNLMDGVRYYVTVTKDLKSEGGATLQSEVTFSFSTMVNLDGQTSNAIAPNTSKDKLQISWFNVAKNKNLVGWKPEVERVYALWEQKDGVWDEDEVTEFVADVSLYVNGSLLETQASVTIQRPDKIAANKKKEGKNTMNFYHDTPDGSSESLKVIIHPRQNNYPEKEFEKSVAAGIRGIGSSIWFTAYSCEMNTWINGVNAAEETAAVTKLIDASDFVTSNYPIINCGFGRDDTIKSGPTGFNMTIVGTTNDANWGQVNVVEAPPGSGKRYNEPDYVMEKMKEKIGLSDDFVVGLVPKDGLAGCNGVSYYTPGRVGDGVILLAESRFTRGTLGHEVLHHYGVDDDLNNQYNDVEGFEVARKANKSTVEGNSDDVDVVNLMQYLAVYQGHEHERFIRLVDYDYLLNKLLPTARAKMQKQGLRRRVQSGSFLVVRGHFNIDNGMIQDANPFYCVTMRYIPAPSGTGYTAELFSGAGGTGTSLGRYAFGMQYMNLMPADNKPSVSIPDRSFIFTIPFNTSAQSLVLKGSSNTVTINRSAFGAAPPTCSFTSPSDVAVLRGKTTISWSGSDDSGTVYYRLEFSPDGVGWTPISGELQGLTSIDVDLSSFASGTGKKLAIIAYDGFSTTRVEINVSIDNDLKVNYTYPADGAINVGLGQSVMAYFIGNIDSATVNKQAFTLLDNNGAQVGGNVFFNSVGKQASFVPSAGLKPGTTYTARLLGGASGIKDTTGKTFASDITWSFTTGQPSTGPYPMTVWPRDGSKEVPLNAIVQAEFNHELDPSTISTATFQVKNNTAGQASGTVSYNSSLWSVVFVPGSPLAPNTTYTATLLGGIKDPAGNALGGDYSWSFTTGSWSSAGVRVIQVTNDLGIDSNSDGLYDLLRVVAHVEILKSSTYNLNGQLRDNDKGDIAWTSASQSVSGAGVFAFNLEFPGNVIAGHGEDGPYEVGSLSVYDVYDASDNHVVRSSYWTRAYKATDFYSPIRLSSIPDIAVAIDSSNQDILNLTDYAKHQTYPPSDLEYTILLNSNPNVGVSIDSSRLLDVIPVAGFAGTSELTLEVKDKDGNRALNSFHVSVIKNYKFSGPGWAALSLPNLPLDTKIQNVLAPIQGKYDRVWGFFDGNWKLYDANAPAFSDLETMEPGWGYWIYLNQAASFMSVGTSAGKRPVSLKTGWNYVGYNSTDTRSITSAVSSIAGKYVLIWSYQDDDWKVFDPGDPGMSDLAEMGPGLSYWIKALVETTWTLE